MLSNPMFIELLVKERHQAFEEEAKRTRLIKLSRANQVKVQIYSVEKFANLLIFFGEYLKRKYCSKPILAANSSIGFSKDRCGC